MNGEHVVKAWTKKIPFNKHPIFFNLSKLQCQPNLNWSKAWKRTVQGNLTGCIHVLLKYLFVWSKKIKNGQITKSQPMYWTIEWRHGIATENFFSFFCSSLFLVSYLYFFMASSFYNQFLFFNKEQHFLGIQNLQNRQMITFPFLKINHCNYYICFVDDVFSVDSLYFEWEI